MLIAQISDCHIVEPGAMFADRVDSAAGLRAAVDTINALETQPDLVLATGDLVDDGRAEQYDHLVSILERLEAPALPLPGNHDDRSELRARFDALPAGAPTEPIDHVDDRHDIRIVCLDTTIPGAHGGDLRDAQLAWLDTVLADSARPTLIAQHHPPIRSGIRWMDGSAGLAAAAADAEAQIVARHPHVEAVVSGHLHRSFQRRWAGTIAATCPSTAAQLGLELVGDDPTYTDEPTGILLHHWSDGLVSHVVPVGAFDRWEPSWADED